jgi:hypothetical protein
MDKLTRRSFIATTAAAAGPYILGAEDRTGSKAPILGEGDHKYEAIHDWGQLPSNIKYGNTHSIVEDSHGHIYVHHTVHKTSQSPDAVVEFDDKGKFVRSWGPMFRGGAHGMHLSKEGKDEFLYFSDDKHGFVTKRTLKGEEVWTIGYPQDSPVYQKGPGSTGPGGANGLNYRPTNIAIAPNGDFWVVDGYGSYYAFHYTVKNGFPVLVNTFGGRPTPPPPAGGAPGAGAAKGKGKEAPPVQAAAGAPPAGGPPARAAAPIDQMNNPHGIWIDTRDAAKPTLMIADRGNRRIVRYTLDDKPIDVIDGTKAPCHFHQYKDMLVVPDLSSRVTLYDKDNKVILHLGDGLENDAKVPSRTTENRGDFIPGKFVAPHGANFDHAGNIYVAEWVEIGRVTKLRKVS